ncbi:hypothetical protein AGMMS49574_07610 [Bacteroidia bacterium]|nr:hypothetical protein AGMMS49574_07610 [Bacteroidia bacterium]
MLNKMSPGEETSFQEHLETCKACRTYVNSIRRLSCLIADEELAYTTTPTVKRQVGRKKKIRLWSFVSIAACIVLIAGVSLYVSNNGTPSHKTYINRQSKADRAEMELEMVFPDKAEIKLPAGRPVEFKWNREVEYKLVVRYGKRMIVEAEGNGSSYRMEAAWTEGLPALEWTLSAGGKELKGIIYIIK